MHVKCEIGIQVCQVMVVSAAWFQYVVKTLCAIIIVTSANASLTFFQMVKKRCLERGPAETGVPKGLLHMGEYMACCVGHMSLASLISTV